LRVEGLGLRVECLWVTGYGLGFRVQGSGFKVQGLGFRVQGSGFRVRSLTGCDPPLSEPYLNPEP